MTESTPQRFKGRAGAGPSQLDSGRKVAAGDAAGALLRRADVLRRRSSRWGVPRHLPGSGPKAGAALAAICNARMITATASNCRCNFDHACGLRHPKRYPDLSYCADNVPPVRDYAKV